MQLVFLLALQFLVPVKMFLSNRLIHITVSVVFFWVVSAELFAEIQPLNADPYDFSAAPQWAKDLRRAEIITLGSVPFVTMGVTFSYSLYRYFAHGMNSAYIPNPFAQSSDAAHLSTSEAYIFIEDKSLRRHLSRFKHPSDREMSRKQ